MPEDDSYDKNNPWILNKMIAFSERLFESDKSANLVVIAFVVLFVLMALGIGITLTRATAPVHQVEASN
ncbi:MAG: hypothetical protein Q7S50_00685 [bacterium]|nr:hypothetical protein [bacterium]